MSDNEVITTLLESIIEREGGYVDHPDDRGGPTRWGITEAVARESGYEGDMANLPVDAAMNIYAQQYVIGPGFDKLLGMSAPIAEACVDCGVHSGPALAGSLLQRLLNVLNGEASYYPDINVDGQVGPQTRGALLRFLDHRGAEGEQVLLAGFTMLRGAFLIEFSERDPSQESFTYGWLLRLVDMAKAH